MEGAMDATTIVVIVLVGMFVVGMGALMIVRETPPKDKSKTPPAGSR
jgi:hypothetical protein